MDKQEYKILSEEIMSLVANEQFVDAAEIADRIDWRKVRSFSTLQKIGELYRINRRYEDAMEIMNMAFNRNPNSRTIVYSLCEISIDLEDVVMAAKYLAMYKRMAPNDKGSMILQYKILELTGAPTEEKIELLEELNHKDYTEEWAYQLAYLYHRIGLATKCVETCDQLITWFGSGPFVIKAIELKMLHAPLTEKQKEIYDGRNAISEEIEAYESDEYTVERAEASVAAEMGEEDFHVKTIDMSKFNTLNLQKALAESMRELLGEENYAEESPLASTGELEQRLAGEDYFYEQSGYEGDNISYEQDSYEGNNHFYEQNGYEGDNVSNEQDNYEEDNNSYEQGPSEEELSPYGQAVSDIMNSDSEGYEINEEVKDNIEGTTVEQKEGAEEPVKDEIFFEDKTGDIIMDQPPVGTNPQYMDVTPKAMDHKTIEKRNTNSVFEEVLSQGNDGQISLIVPEETVVEKQITGQLNLEDVLREWENVKKRKEAEQKAKTQQLISEETGKIFADFEALSKTGPLARIESENNMFTSKYRENEIELRSVEDILNSNPSTEGSIWDEVDAALEADKKEEKEKTGESGSGVVDAVVDGVVATGVAAAGVVAAGVVSGGAVAAESAVVAVEGAAVATEAVASVEEELSPYGQAVSDVMNDEPIEEEISPDTVSEDTAESENFAGDNEESKEAVTEGTETMEESVEAIVAERESEITSDIVAENTALKEVNPEEEEPVNEPMLNTSQIDNIGNALEAEADKVGADSADPENDTNIEEEEQYLTEEERELFPGFMYSKKMANQILDAIDLISLAPYVGNVIITGDSGTGVIELAKAMIKEIQMIDVNFSANRVAKISGDKMNRKDIAALLEQLPNGALIIEKAGDMTKDTLQNLTRVLENNPEGIIIILTDTKKAMSRLIDQYELLTGYFNARIDIKPMNNNALVEYAKKYAYSREYKIDEERAVLALHQRISELQIGEHIVTTREIEDIVDEAIDRSKSLRLSTYIDVLIGKRYDYEDMIILREKDFD